MRRGRTLPLLFFGRFLLRLQPLHEDFCSPRNMIATEPLCFRAVARDDGIEDRNMLAEDGLRHLRTVAQHLAHDASQIGPVRRGEPDVSLL